MALYGVSSYWRSDFHGSWLQDSLPSLLFFPAAFSVIGFLPKRWGGASQRPISLRTWWFGVIIGVIFLEGIGPLIGLGVADWKDVLMLVTGAFLYRVFILPQRLAN